MYNVSIFNKFKNINIINVLVNTVGKLLGRPKVVG